MKSKSTPHFDATFPSFLRKAPAETPGKPRVRRRQAGTRRVKKATLVFFGRDLLLAA